MKKKAPTLYESIEHSLVVVKSPYESYLKLRFQLIWLLGVLFIFTYW